MKKLIYILTLASLSFNLFSCKKNEGCTDPNALNYDSSASKDNNSCIYESDTTAPIIVINSPNGDMKPPGTNISIDIYVTDNDEINQINSTLKCMMNDSIYWFNDIVGANASEKQITDNWVAFLPQGIMMSDFILNVVATDNEGNSEQSSVTFHVM